MTPETISRRDFLKLGTYFLGALTLPEFPNTKKVESEIFRQAVVEGVPNQQSWTFNLPELSLDDKVLIYKVPTQILSGASSIGVSYLGKATVIKEKRQGDWVEIRDVPQTGIHRTTTMELDWGKAIIQHSFMGPAQIELPNIDNGSVKDPGEAYVFALTANEKKFGWQMFLTPNITINGISENRGGDFGYSTKMKLIY